MLSELDARKGLLVLFPAPTAWLLVAWIGGRPVVLSPWWVSRVDRLGKLTVPAEWSSHRGSSDMDIVSTPWRAPSQRPNSSFSSAYTTDGCFPWPLLCSCCWQSGSQCPAPFVWPAATQPGEQLHCPAGCVQPQLPWQSPNPGFGEGPYSKCVFSLGSLTEPSGIL